MESSNQAPEIKNERPLTDQEKSEVLKKLLFDQFDTAYKNFCGVINKTPLHKQIKEHVIYHVDTAYLWAKEAFAILSFDKPASIAPSNDNPVDKDQEATDAA